MIATLQPDTADPRLILRDEELDSGLELILLAEAALWAAVDAALEAELAIQRELLEAAPMSAATKGKVIAHLVKANLPPTDGTGWHKHIADFQRGFELANLDITQPVARREENGDVRPFRDAPAAGAEPAANEPRVELA